MNYKVGRLKENKVKLYHNYQIFELEDSDNVYICFYKEFGTYFLEELPIYDSELGEVAVSTKFVEDLYKDGYKIAIIVTDGYSYHKFNIE